MPKLSKKMEDKRLIVDLTLISMENLGDPEGWLNSSITIKTEDRLISGTRGTIHDSDIRQLVQRLRESARKNFDFEPLEPDFTVVGKPSDSHDVMLGWHIQEDKFYDGSGIGVRTLIKYHQVQAFADELSQELNAITGGKPYEL